MGNLNVQLQMKAQIVKLQHRMPKMQAKFKSWILAEIERHTLSDKKLKYITSTLLQWIGLNKL